MPVIFIGRYEWTVTKYYLINNNNKIGEYLIVQKSVKIT
jgi:hypothetical protein